MGILDFIMWAVVAIIGLASMAILAACGVAAKREATERRMKAVERRSSRFIPKRDAIWPATQPELHRSVNRQIHWRRFDADFDVGLPERIERIALVICIERAQKQAAPLEAA